nr:hypothetical protein [Tanacetum cinerariifolium]
MEESLSKFMTESTKRHEENSNLIKEIRASTNAAIRNQGASIKALEIQIGQISKVLQERGSGNLPSSTKTNLRDHVKLILMTVDADTTPIHRIRPNRYVVSSPKKSLGKLAPTRLTIKLVDKTVKYPKDLAKNMLVEIDKFVFFGRLIVLDMPEDTKIPLILGRPFLSTAYAKIDVFKQKIALKVGNNKIVFKSDSPTSNIITRVYVLGLRERMKLDLDARLIGEALILNRSDDPDFGDFIALNDLNEPLELRNHEIKNLGLTIEEGEVIDKPKVDTVQTRDDDIIVETIDEYPNFCDYDRKINDNWLGELAPNMLIVELADRTVKCPKDKVGYKGKNVVGAFMNVLIFVGNFSVIVDFLIVENMDSYRDERMGDIIVGRPFCREACIKARRFDGMITIYNRNDSVTYQMVRSYPWFKHLTNAQCNKMRPLSKVSAHNELK